MGSGGRREGLAGGEKVVVGVRFPCSAVLYAPHVWYTDAIISTPLPPDSLADTQGPAADTGRLVFFPGVCFPSRAVLGILHPLPRF